jgi:superfamily II DNA or RNA helicase
VIELAQQTDIPVFWREDLSSDMLYERRRLQIVPSPAECVYNFVKDADGLRYYISLTCQGRQISLQKKPGLVLSEKPCVVVTGKEIFCVENTEARKLKPFFVKSHIDVPVQTEEAYLKSFVFKTMKTYEVNIQGIAVRKIEPAKQAYLSLERDFHQKLVFILSFQYEDAPRIFPDSSKRKIVELEEQQGASAIRWYERDKQWEAQRINQLLEEGLRIKGSNHFYPPPQENGDETPYLLIEWLNQREQDSLSDFILEYNLERDFCIKPVALLPDFEAKIDWFELNIIVTIGEYTLPFSCFRQHILTGNNEYILPDQTIFILPQEWFAKYHDLFLFSEKQGDELRLKKVYTSLLEHTIGKQVPEKKRQLIGDILQIPLQRPPLPPQHAATLRPYQKDGFYWLQHLYKNGFGGCLADDMGLGKTLQTITLLQHIYAGDPALPASLVVAPTSLLHNWKNELTRFAPELKVYMYAGEQRLKSGEDARQKFFDRQVVVISYGLMRNDIDYLSDYTFQLLILDESQYIKNPSSQAYRAAMQLDSSHKLTLTGTPVENSLEDLWAQFNFINDGLLGHLADFRQDFIQPIVKEKNAEQTDLLKRLISPFLLRRTKEEVSPELPPLLQEVVYCDMSEAQENAYEIEKNRIRNLLLEAKEQSEQPHNTFIALQGLNKLRQLANHPALTEDDYTDNSGKTEQVISSFETLKASGHKVLIFSSYVRYLNLLAAHFDSEGWKYAMLTGETKKREEAIQYFTANSDVHAFFISLKAGSTGLNLTAADYVFILDPWWNPAAEMQAMSRAHRIGQVRNVIACRFISTATVEEKIMLLQAKKTALYNTFINENNPLSSFTWEEIEELLN